MLAHAPWTALPGLHHGFLDRDDCRDAPDWAAVMRRVGSDRPLARPRQVHGATVLVSDEVTPASEGDAVIATRPGVTVGIVTADCAPILLRDRGGRAVAAVHAGWRGAAAGVLEATLAALRRIAGIDARDVEAAIGPAVGGCCYEVGPEVRHALIDRAGGRATLAFTARGDRFMFDLRAAIRTLATEAGLATTLVGPCTMCSAGYASYRRDGERAGRQLSFIALL
jgi:YfiH family protein